MHMEVHIRWSLLPDLHLMWMAVTQVCLKKRWASIGRCFNPPSSMTNLSFHIKRIFERYLLPFEQVSGTSGTVIAKNSCLLVAFSSQGHEEE